MPDFSLVPVDYQPDFSDVSFIPVEHDPFGDDDVIQQAQAQPVQFQPLQPRTVQPQPASPLQPPAAGAPAGDGSYPDFDGFSANPGNGVRDADIAGNDGYVSPAAYFKTPVNPNLAFGELNNMKEGDELNKFDDSQKRTITGKGYASGVREGNIRRYPDKSMDVTNGTIITFSYENGQAHTVTVTNDDI